MPDRVLVIGGSGHTGRLIVRLLLEQERAVRAMSRRAAGDDPRVGEIGRDDLAAVCVAALSDRNTHGKTLVLYADRGPPRLTGRRSSRGSPPTGDRPRRE